MAITISGQNNNDKILASDGVLDSISGFNVVGVMTAAQFDVTGKTTTNHLNIGSNIQIGNAGIITATTLIGNVTGNINHASNLLLQIGGSEKFRISSAGQLGIGGNNYGTAGQVLTSQGNSSAVQWATPSSGLAMADMWRLTTTYSIPTNSTAILSTANWERPDQTDGFAQLGTGMSVNSSDHAAGVWTFPSTGFYLVTYNGIVYNGSNDPVSYTHLTLPTSALV